MYFRYAEQANQDRTFVFKSFSSFEGVNLPEMNKSGKGKWVANGNLITFSSNKKGDFDAEYTLDFNTSTARFVTKNPRDKTNQIVKTRLVFLESGIFWMERLAVYKI